MSDMHMFNVAEAERHGMKKAILLHALRNRIDHDRADKHNLHDGVYWTSGSAASLAKIMPYFSSKSIHRWLQELEKDEIIKSSQEFNKSPQDNTKWYTITGEYTEYMEKCYGTY